MSSRVIEADILAQRIADRRAAHVQCRVTINELLEEQERLQRKIDRLIQQQRELVENNENDYERIVALKE